jgi:hypothetical protein
VNEISYSTLSEALPGARQIVTPTSCQLVEEEDLGCGQRGECLPFVVRR